MEKTKIEEMKRKWLDVPKMRACYGWRKYGPIIILRSRLHCVRCTAVIVMQLNWAEV